MPAPKLVYVEVNDSGLPVRIFKTTKEAFLLPPEKLEQMERGRAVGLIREQVFSRARRGLSYYCEYCGDIINEFLGEMHEKIPKGSGGEVSLDNCVALCHGCHTGKQDSEHGDRRFQSAKLKKENNGSND